MRYRDCKSQIPHEPHEWFYGEWHSRQCRGRKQPTNALTLSQLAEGISTDGLWHYLPEHKMRVRVFDDGTIEAAWATEDTRATE